MAKLFTKIGYAPSFEQTAPGVWEEVITVKKYYGEILRNTRRLDSSEKVNSDINISNRISIVADPYARENFHQMRWIEFMGTKWIITEVEVEYPRLILSVGGVYTEQEDEEEEDADESED